MGNADSIPIISQTKSLVQVMAGDVEGARRTQDNFCETAPVVSQVTSLVHAFAGNEQRARDVQERFLENLDETSDGFRLYFRLPKRMRSTDSIPIISQTKSLAQVMLGDADGARKTQENFCETTPVVSQVTSLVHAIAGDEQRALAVQKRFLKNVYETSDGFPIVGQVNGVIHDATEDKPSGNQSMMDATGSFADVAGFAVRGPVAGDACAADVEALHAYDM